MLLLQQKQLKNENFFGLMLRFALLCVLITFNYYVSADNSVSSFSEFDWKESFEENINSWYPIEASKTCSITGHRRVADEYRHGKQSEFVEITFSEKGTAIFGHAIDYPWVIEDLSPSLWLKSESLGIAIGAQVVLPNSVNPATGKPISFLVVGNKYVKFSEWERIGFYDKAGKCDLQERIERVIRTLRVEFGSDLDIREQYVRQLVLFVEGKPNAGETLYHKQIWIDSIEVLGHVSLWPEHIDKLESKYDFCFDPVNVDGFLLAATSDVVFPSTKIDTIGGGTRWEDPYLSQTGIFQQTPKNSVVQTSFTEPISAPEEGPYQSNIIRPKSVIRMSSQQLSVDGAAFAVRAIEYRGEPLSLLQKLGFNAVWISDPPSSQLLQESKQIGIRIICPPPSASNLSNAGIQPNALPRPVAEGQQGERAIGDLYDNVLAWDLGARCVWAHNTDAQQWAGLVRSADPLQRPFVCAPDSGILEYSLIADVLLFRRDPLLSSLELQLFGKWQQSMQRLARPGTPIWATVQTQPDPKLVHQWDLIGGGGPLPAVISFEQMQLLVRYGIANGAHGFLFTSNTPLTSDDTETRYRATALELINLELALIDEWVAKGRVFGDGSGIIETNRTNMSGILLEANQARLLMPVWHEAGSQFALGTASASNVEFRVPVPVTYRTTMLLPGGTPPLNTRQKAGGREILLREANMSTFVFMTQSPEMIEIVTRRCRQFGKRAAELTAELARLHLASTEATLGLLMQAQDTNSIVSLELDQRPLISLREQQTLIVGAKKEIDFCQFLIDSRDYTEAFLQGLRATQGLRVTQRNLWLEATRSDRNRCLFPVSVSFLTTPHYVSLYSRLSRATLSPNRLIAGDAESPNDWQQAGWRLYKHAMKGVVPRFSFSQMAAHTGNLGMRLSASPEQPEKPITTIETAPFWAETHGMPVHGGEMICVNGHVNIPTPLVGSVDGLMILDTIGGEPLALRFDKTEGWQEFTFYRFVPNNGEYRIKFLMTGFGDAYLDDIKVSAVQWDSIAPPPNASPVETPSTTPFWRVPLEQLNPLRLLPRNNP